MSKEKLQNQIINDLKNDFPNIIVEKEENSNDKHCSFFAFM